MNITKKTIKHQPGGWDKVGQGLRSRQGPFSYLEAEHHGQKAEFVTQNQCFEWMWDLPIFNEMLKEASRAEVARMEEATWAEITDNGRYSCD